MLRKHINIMYVCVRGGGHYFYVVPDYKVALTCHVHVCREWKQKIHVKVFRDSLYLVLLMSYPSFIHSQAYLTEIVYLKCALIGV